MSITEPHVDLDARDIQARSGMAARIRNPLFARAAYHALAGNPDADLDAIDRARELYERSEAGMSQSIDRLESRVAGRF